MLDANSAHGRQLCSRVADRHRAAATAALSRRQVYAQNNPRQSRQQEADPEIGSRRQNGFEQGSGPVQYTSERNGGNGLRQQEYAWQQAERPRQEQGQGMKDPRRDSSAQQQQQYYQDRPSVQQGWAPGPDTRRMRRNQSSSYQEAKYAPRQSMPRRQSLAPPKVRLYFKFTSLCLQELYP